MATITAAARMYTLAEAAREPLQAAIGQALQGATFADEREYYACITVVLGILLGEHLALLKEEALRAQMAETITKTALAHAPLARERMDREFAAQAGSDTTH